MKTLKLVSIISLLSLPTVDHCLAWQVSGRVYCDLNGNGQIDSSDSPLVGVSVTVVNLAGSFSASAVTGVGGAYVIAVAEVPDTYVASLRASTLPTQATILIPTTGSAQFSLSDAALEATVDFLISSPECRSQPSAGGCWLTGGGTIGATKAKPSHSFGGNVFPGCSPTAGEGGQWNHVAHSLDLHFLGTSMTVVRCGNVEGIPPGSSSPRTPFNFIEFTGTGRLSGIHGNDADSAEVFFFARAEDRAEPGKQVDRYFLNVFTDFADPVGSSIFVVDIDGNPATVDPVPIRSGNLQMHISSCGEQPQQAQSGQQPGQAQPEQPNPKQAKQPKAKSR